MLISLDKLDATLSKAKGYLEFRGRQEGKGDVVLRFNRMALKNNYRPSDLLKMNLTLYAVYVGECRIDDLVADKELGAEGFTVMDNPDYSDEQVSPISVELSKLAMYDVLLAGVSSKWQLSCTSSLVPTAHFDELVSSKTEESDYTVRYLDAIRIYNTKIRAAQFVTPGAFEDMPERVDNCVVKSTDFGSVLSHVVSSFASILESTFEMDRLFVQNPPSRVL